MGRTRPLDLGVIALLLARGADSGFPTWLVMPPLSRVVVLPDKN